MTDRPLDLPEAERLAQMLANRPAQFIRLYLCANKLMGRLGADGEISARSDTVSEFMDALYDIDDGEPIEP